MRRREGISRLGLGAWTACAAAVIGAALAAAPAGAADFYVTGKLQISNAMGDASGNTEFFGISGNDKDTSPVYGGAIGFELPIDEVLPRIGDLYVPNWRIRTEVEGLAGHDYEMRASGGDGFFSEATAWSLMNNWWMDVPIHSGVAWLFGRMPILEPVSVFVGGGVGLSFNEVKATDNISLGKDNSYELAWNAGAGLSYEFTDVVAFSAGYRYQDFGDFETRLTAQPNPGVFRLSLTSHLFTTGLRIRFYSVELPTYER